MYKEIVNGPLKTKTVLITTNDTVIMELVDKIVVFDEKEAIDMGSYQNFVDLQNFSNGIAGEDLDLDPEVIEEKFKSFSETNIKFDGKNARMEKLRKRLAVTSSR
jgi:energy-coupling factor transporter ATP-binding protein EcfA2